LKLSRAQDHLQEAECVVAQWIEAAQETVVEKPDPKRSGDHGAWIDPPVFPADELSLLVGDCLQCFRSTLDHLAFELATTFTTPLPDDFAKASEFPIFEEGPGRGSAGFHKRRSKGARAGDPAPGSGLAKIQGINPCAQAVIEGLQPYHRGKTFGDDPLWRLHELNRLDKHRVLHIIANRLGGVTLDPSRWENVAPEIGPGSIQTLTGPVKGRTQVARWGSKTFKPMVPGKKMRVNFRPVASPG
jgi:hypothetical protein